jgi:transposase
MRQMHPILATDDFVSRRSLPPEWDMNDTSNDFQDLLRQAAEMRCDGLSWATIATRLNRSAATVSSWPRKYRAAWQRWMAEASRAAEASAQAEARATLRQMLRSDNEKTVLAAATVLRKPRRRSSARTSTAPPELMELVSHVQQLSDDELRQLLATTPEGESGSSRMAPAAGPA